METQRNGTVRSARERRWPECVWCHEERTAHLDLTEDGEGERQIVWEHDTACSRWPGHLCAKQRSADGLLTGAEGLSRLLQPKGRPVAAEPSHRGLHQCLGCGQPL